MHIAPARFLEEECRESTEAAAAAAITPILRDGFVVSEIALSFLLHHKVENVDNVANAFGRHGQDISQVTFLWGESQFFYRPAKIP